MRAHMKVLTYFQILTISFFRKTFTGSRAFTLELELKAVIMDNMTVASQIIFTVKSLSTFLHIEEATTLGRPLADRQSG